MNEYIILNKTTIQMKILKNKKTGEIATYKDGIFKIDRTCIDIGVEPSPDVWEPFEFPIGTKVKCDDRPGIIYEKFEGGWGYLPTSIQRVYIDEVDIAEHERFHIVEMK